MRAESFQYYLTGYTALVFSELKNYPRTNLGVGVLSFFQNRALVSMGEAETFPSLLSCTVMVEKLSRRGHYG